jgi:hypothetical protein
MTGYPDFNFPAFNEAADFLKSVGYDVFNPADRGIVPGWEHSDYLRYDIPKVLEADLLVMLPGWENSKGAALEHHIATVLGLPTPTFAEVLQAKIHEDDLVDA